jgi:hypothetical protein
MFVLDFKLCVVDSIKQLLDGALGLGGNSKCKDWFVLGWFGLFGLVLVLEGESDFELSRYAPMSSKSLSPSNTVLRILQQTRLPSFYAAR